MNISEKLIASDHEKRKAIIEKIKKEGEKYGIYPLSPNQYSLWCKYKVSKGKSDITNACFAVKLDNITLEKLNTALEKLFGTEAVLRYRFLEADGQVFQYADNEAVFCSEYIDISDNSSTSAKLDELEKSFFRAPFDLEHGLPLRATIIKLKEGCFELMFCIHHIISDAMSVGVFLNDLYALLEGKTVHKPTEFGAYAAKKCSDIGLEKQLQNEKYWTDKIADTEKFLDIPVCGTRGVHGSIAVSDMLISGQKLAMLNSAAKKYDSNLFVILSSVFSIILHNLTNKDKMIVATTFFNRKDKNTLSIMGDFASIVPYVFDFRDDITLAQYFQQNTSDFYEAIDHSDVTFSRIANHYAYTNSENINPVYQVAMVYHKSSLIGMDTNKVGDIGVEVKDLAQEGNIEDIATDLYIKITDDIDSLKLSVIYDTALFDRKTIENLLCDYNYILERIEQFSNTPLFSIELNKGTDINVTTSLENVKKLRRTKLENKPVNSFISGEKKIIILNRYGHSLPKGYYGDAIISENSEYYETGMVCRINSSNNVEFASERKYLLEYKNKLIDLREAAREAEHCFKITNAFFECTANEDIIFNYSSDEIILSADEIEKTTGILPVFTYKADKNTSSVKNSRHKNNILKAYELMTQKGFAVSTKQMQNSNATEMIFTAEKAPLRSIITEINASVKDENIHYVFKRIDALPFRYIFSEHDNVIEKLCDIWKAVLGINEVDIYENFYNIGGDSLKVYALFDMIQKEFDVSFNISDLFNYNNIHDMSSYIKSLCNDFSYSEHTAEIHFF